MFSWIKGKIFLYVISGGVGGGYFPIFHLLAILMSALCEEESPPFMFSWGSIEGATSNPLNLIGDPSSLALLGMTPPSHPERSEGSPNIGKGEKTPSQLTPKGKKLISGGVRGGSVQLLHLRRRSLTAFGVTKMGEKRRLLVTSLLGVTHNPVISNEVRNLLILERGRSPLSNISSKT